MKYDIVSAPSYSLIEMKLSEGESVIVEPGSILGYFLKNKNRFTPWRSPFGY